MRKAVNRFLTFLLVIALSTGGVVNAVEGEFDSVYNDSNNIMFVGEANTPCNANDATTSGPVASSGQTSNDPGADGVIKPEMTSEQGRQASEFNGPVVFGASIFGGEYRNGNWYSTNTSQGVQIGKSDDNGFGAYMPKFYGKQPLAGYAAVAELSNFPKRSPLDFSAMGKIPGQKLKITYGSKSVIAQVLDVGKGNRKSEVADAHKGRKRAIDLWWETARLLDFKDGMDVVTVEKVPADTPLTPITGAAAPGSSAPSPATPTSTNPACTPAETGEAGASGSSIIDAAKLFAWDQRKVGKQGAATWEAAAKSEFVNALKTSNPEAYKNFKDVAFADCGMFVSTVMRYTKADPNYPPSGTGIQRDYVQSHQDIYYTKTNPSFDELQPGDILVVNNGSAHHTLIFTGKIGVDSSGKDQLAIDASQESRVPSRQTKGSVDHILSQPGVVVARVKKK